MSRYNVKVYKEEIMPTKGIMSTLIFHSFINKKRKCLFLSIELKFLKERKQILHFVRCVQILHY